MSLNSPINEYKNCICTEDFQVTGKTICFTTPSNAHNFAKLSSFFSTVLWVPLYLNKIIRYILTYLMLTQRMEPRHHWWTWNRLFQQDALILVHLYSVQCTVVYSRKKQTCNCSVHWTQLLKKTLGITNCYLGFVFNLQEDFFGLRVPIRFIYSKILLFLPWLNSPRRAVLRSG